MDELTHAEDREQIRTHWRHTWTTGEPTEFDQRVVHPGVAVRHLRTHLDRAPAAAGSPAVLQGTQLDTTDITQVRQEAQHAHDYLNAVLTASPDYILVTELATAPCSTARPGR